MEEKVETIIVGGGQAGLALSYYLTQQHCEHLILEQAPAPVDAWRNRRWDSFTLNTPNWATRLPGAEYAGPDRNGFMPRAELVAYFDRYVADHRLPVQPNTRVTAVEPQARGYRVQAADGRRWQARNVVVATGLFQVPKVPPYAAHLPAGLLSLPAEHYRSPDALPPGAVLVVGSAQTGCQIAEELHEAGRKVYLCVGTAGRFERSYRGKDIVEWLALAGFWERTAVSLPSPQARFAGNPHISGTRGGHTINLHQFCRDGIVLLGRLAGMQDGKAVLAGDLKQNLAKSDAIAASILKVVDDYIAKEGLDAPAAELPVLRDGYDAPELIWLDLVAAGVGTVIWAGGFAFDYSLVRLPVVDAAGFPVTQDCATRYAGLYFLGLPWLTTRKSGLLMGVAEDAARICNQIAAH